MFYFGKGGIFKYNIMSTLSAREYFAKLKIGDLFFNNFLNAVKSGNNTVSHSIITESMVADDAWINEIEGLLFSVEKIVKDPKKSIIDEKVIVQVEKAKKITSETIRHLSSHSNLIRSIEENGDVRPSKVLTVFMEEDFLIYENRFVYTLITRLTSFLEQKYNYLKEYAGTFGTNKLKLQSEFKYNNTFVEYDLNIRVKNSLKEDSILKNENILYRIEQLKKRVFVLTGSEFYRHLLKTRPLSPPIAKTNIIMMNVNYKNCYKLWLFLSSFINTGYSVKVSDKTFPFEQDYIDDLTYLVAISIKAMMLNNGFTDNFEIKDKYIEQEPKEYSVIKDINYTPTFNYENNEAIDDDYINQFYFEEIKKILTSKEEKEPERIDIKTDFAFPFTNFYRQLSNINNLIFAELLEYKNEKNQTTELTKLQLKQEKLQFQKELYRRNKLLTRLKAIDYKDTERKEIQLLAKVKKLQLEVNILKNKEKNTELSDADITAQINLDKNADNNVKDKKKTTVKDVVAKIIEKDNKLSAEILKEKEKK